MKFPALTGSGRAFMGGRVIPITWITGPGKYASTSVQIGSRDIEVTDYEDRFDVYYGASDDGSVYHTPFVLLDPAEAPPVNPPTEADLAKDLITDLTPMMLSVGAQQTHPDDMVFCRIVFATPVFMLRFWQFYGSIAQARKEILRQVFRI